MRLMMTKKLKIAKNECANWNVGNCIGCMVYIDSGYLERNNWAPVFQSIDSKKANKPCQVDKGCSYFDLFVAK